jgi:peroxiredoxin
MAQLRHDYPKFQALNTEVLVLVPNGPKLIGRYAASHNNPYPILSDKGARVAEQYGIKIRSAVLIQAFTPSVFLVDQSGAIRYLSYQSSYIQEPDNSEPLAVLEQMAAPV